MIEEGTSNPAFVVPVPPPRVPFVANVRRLRTRFFQPKNQLAGGRSSATHPEYNRNVAVIDESREIMQSTVAPLDRPAH